MSELRIKNPNPVEASEFFLGSIRNCLNCFTTAKISFTSIDGMAILPSSGVCVDYSQE